MTLTISPPRLLKRTMTDRAAGMESVVTSFSAAPAMARVAAMPVSGEEAVNQLLAQLQIESTDFDEELAQETRQLLVHNPRQKRDALLVRMMREDSPWLALDAQDQARMVTCLESGHARVMDWILANEGTPETVRLRLIALAEAAASSNDAFVDFVLNPGTGVERITENKMRLCRQIFDKWPLKSALDITKNPGILHVLDEKELALALRFNTINSAMITFAAANADLVGNWPRPKIRRIREAFELEIPALTVYIKGNVQAWNMMKDDQMVQTIRAFRIGNESHLRQIVANKPGKQWHLSSASAMLIINNSMEEDFGLGRFLVRRAWMKNSR